MTSRRPLLAGAIILSLGACRPSGPGVPQVCEASTTRRSGLRSQCGPSLEFIPINSYQGEIANVQEREDAVALINGICTGTVIEAKAGPVVLTAGHCVALGDRPLLVFNFEDEPDGDPLVTEGTVIEQADEPDYALIQLDVLPAATPVPLTVQVSDRVAVIQHPRGSHKVIAEGNYLDSCNGLLYYTDLDTLVGSSGAPVLNRQGYLLAIHTDGDCTEDGQGANRGWTAAAIVEASAHLQGADIADR